MKEFYMMIKALSTLIACFACALCLQNTSYAESTEQVGTHAFASDLSEHFINPPEETKPWCYWYWLGGDISKEGITKDLESMARVGIRRAMIGNVNAGKAPENPIKMLTPEWYEATHHAFREANRVGVELDMFNGPGWSQSGGPWIKPEQSMRRVTWNEVSAKGGTFSQKVRNICLLVPALTPLLFCCSHAAVSSANTKRRRKKKLYHLFTFWVSSKGCYPLMGDMQQNYEWMGTSHLFQGA